MKNVSIKAQCPPEDVCNRISDAMNDLKRISGFKGEFSKDDYERCFKAYDGYSKKAEQLLGGFKIYEVLMLADEDPAYRYRVLTRYYAKDLPGFTDDDLQDLEDLWEQFKGAPQKLNYLRNACVPHIDDFRKALGKIYAGDGWEYEAKKQASNERKQ